MNKLFPLFMVILIGSLSAQEDTTLVSLTYFTFNPDSVNVASGPDTVTITIGASDDLSGLFDASVYFISPSGIQSAYCNVNFNLGSLADTVNGTIIIEQHAEAGDWLVQEIHLYDVAGNEAIISTFDLQTMGLPTKLHVHIESYIVDDKLLPFGFRLFQNYPNPFNPLTNIRYSIPYKSHVNLSVIDILGREITVLTNEEHLIGNYEETFDGSNLPAGLYYYQLMFNNSLLTKKMLLIK